MASPIEQSMLRAIAAFDALAAAESFTAARTAWEDFLTHWRRTLNRCDAEGARLARRTYAPCYARVEADPALSYLWAARNAEEHGVAEIATLQESAFALAAFGGYQEEEGEPGPNGERTFTYTPLTDDPPPFFAVLPEHIKLVPIRERSNVVPVPRDYTYDLGETPAPVALATVGLDFLRQELASLAKLGSGRVEP
jgi:hypothetical protein